MVGKLSTILSVFVKRCTYIPCREFQLPVELLNVPRESFLPESNQSPDSSDRKRKRTRSMCDESCDSKYLKSDFEDVESSPVRDAKCLPRYSAREFETLEKSFAEKWKEDSQRVGFETDTKAEVLMDEVTLERTESAETDEVLAECNAVGVGCSTDSDFEISTSGSSVRSTRSKRHKISPKLSKVNEKRAVSSSRDAQSSKKERPGYLGCLPLHFRTCYLCSLGCEYASVVCCQYCDNVFHPFCLTESEVSASKASCVEHEKDPSFVHNEDGFWAVSSMAKSCVLKWIADENTEAFKTRTLSSIPGVNNDSRSAPSVPESVKNLYRERRLALENAEDRTLLQLPESKATSEQNSCNFFKDVSKFRQKWFPDKITTDGAAEINEALSTYHSKCNEFQSDPLTQIQKTSPAMLLFVDANMDSVIRRFDLFSFQTVATVGTNSSSCDINLNELKSCKFASSVHCKIFYSSKEAQFELLNYSPFGVAVDDVVYCFDDSGSTAVDVSRHDTPVDSCECRDSLKSRASFDQLGCRRWQGSAVLSHGSAISIGCLNFVFAVL